MKYILVLLISLLFTTNGYAEGPVASPTSGNGIEWNAVTAADLAKYHIYCRSTKATPYDKANPFAVINKPLTQQPFLTKKPVEGQNYCVATALDLVGNESVFSNEIAFVFDSGAPDAPVIRWLMALAKQLEAGA